MTQTHSQPPAQRRRPSPTRSVDGIVRATRPVVARQTAPPQEPVTVRTPAAPTQAAPSATPKPKPTPAPTALQKPRVARRSRVPIPAPSAKTRARIAATRAALPRTNPLWSLAQYPIVATLAVAAAYNTIAGHLLIAGYVVYAIHKRLDSSLSFGLGLGLLVCIPLFQFLGLSAVSQHAAIYTFELVAFGCVQAVLDAVRRRRVLRELAMARRR